MGRRKGSLNKSTLQKMQNMENEGRGDVTMQNKTATAAKAEVETTNGKTKIVKSDFNPDDFRQYYEDGTPYLPFAVQLQWFRKVYPNGKIKTFRPDWSPEKEASTYIATARVYMDANDAEDCYLAEASAKRGPDTKIMESEISIDPFNDCQRAALSFALRLAGFWCSLDKKPMDTEEEPKESEKVKEEKSDNSEKKSSSKKETAQVEKAVEKVSEETPEKKSSEEKTAEETPVDAVDAEKESSKNTEVEEVSAEKESEKSSTEEVPSETSESVEDKDVETVEEKDEAPVEEDSTKNTSEKAVPTEEDSVEKVPNEETSAEKTSVDEVSTEATSIEETSTEETASEPEEKKKISEDDLSDEEKAELAECRSIPFANGYYDGSLGDLEQKKNQGEELGQSLIAYLLFSPMAARRKAKEKAGITRIAELLYPEWLEELN